METKELFLRAPFILYVPRMWRKMCKIYIPMRIHRAAWLGEEGSDCCCHYYREALYLSFPVLDANRKGGEYNTQAPTHDSRLAFQTRYLFVLWVWWFGIRCWLASVSSSQMQPWLSLRHCIPTLTTHKICKTPFLLSFQSKWKQTTGKIHRPWTMMLTMFSGISWEPRGVDPQSPSLGLYERSGASVIKGLRLTSDTP